MRSPLFFKAVSFIAAFALTVVVVSPAYAEEASEELDEFWQPTFTVTTDKAAYGANDQITVTATAVNDLDVYESLSGGLTDSAELLEADMNLAIQVPAGYTVVSGNATTTANDVAAGSSATTQVVLAKNETTTTSTLTKTGDSLYVVIAAVCALAALALLVMLLTRKRAGREASKRMLCGLMALTLVVGLSPFAALSAYGDDSTDGDDSSDDDGCNEHDTQGSVTFTVDGESLTITATAEVDIYEGDYYYQPGSEEEEEEDPAVEEVEDPSLQSTITDVNITSDTNGYTVVMLVEPFISMGTGTFDLTKSSVTVEDTSLSGGGTAPYAGTVQVTGANSFQVTRKFTTEEVQQMVSGNTDPLKVLLPLAVYDFVQHKVTITEGALSNSAGQVMPADSMYPIIGVDLDDTSQLNTLSVNSADNSLTTNDASKDKEIAAESLEIGQEVLNAIGEFVEGMDKHPGEFFMGAGSLLGMASKIITTEDGAGDLYDTKDIIDRLDSISTSIDKLSAQVSSLDATLHNIESKAEYEMNVNNVCSLISRANSYEKILLSYLDGLDNKTSGAASDTSKYEDIASQLPDAYQTTYKTLRNSYDTLSDNDKKQLTDLAECIKATDAAIGKESIIGVAQDLADYVTAQSSAGFYGASNVYQYYFDYTGSYFNWECETYDMRKSFMGEYNMAFSYAYCCAMVRLNVEIATSTSPTVIMADLTLRENLMKQANQMKDICKSSDIQNAISARSDGTMLNLVNKKLFKMDDCFAVSHFSGYYDLLTSADDISSTPEIQFVSQSTSIDKSTLLSSENYSQLETDISSGEFITMFRNLKAVKQLDGYKNVGSLYDEMLKVGVLSYDYNYTYEYKECNYRGFCWDDTKNCWVPNVYYDKSRRYNVIDTGDSAGALKSSSYLQVKNMERQSNNHYFYISTNSNPVKLKSSPGSEYIYNYTGTVVDISATSESSLVQENVLLYQLDHFKRVGHSHWYMQVTFNPMSVAKAS